MITQWKDKDKLTLNGKQLREFAKLNYDSGQQAEQKRVLEIHKRLSDKESSWSEYDKRFKKEVEKK